MLKRSHTHDWTGRDIYLHGVQAAQFWLEFYRGTVEDYSIFSHRLFLSFLDYVGHRDVDTLSATVITTLIVASHSIIKVD